MRKIGIIVLTALVLVGCVAPTPTEGLREIRFASKYSRALIENSADLQQQELKLFATYTLDGNSARLFDAERLYYDASLPGWDYNNTQYWMSKASYHFCAICPYIAPCTFLTTNNRVLLADYEGSTNGPDLLYSTAVRDLSAGADFSPVFLQFNHACAAVKFNLINASNATLTDVRNIRLVGLYSKGDFSFDTQGLVEWRLGNVTVADNATVQPYGGTCTLPNSGLPVNINVKHSLYDGGAILVLPQSVYKTQIVLHLEYIKAGDAAYAIRDIKLGWISDTAPTEWKAGEKYEYNLTITDNTITTEVKVVPWIDHYVDL